MRKLLLTVVVLFLLAAQCLAANWEMIGSTNDYGLYYDKDSVVFDAQESIVDRGKYIVNKDKCYVWLKAIYDKKYVNRRFKDNTSYELTYLGLDLVNNRIYMGETIFYNQEGEVVTSSKGIKKWEPIAPESIGEAIKKEVVKYVRNHTEEIERRTRGN
ncbi:hypothetical protein [Selenomonas ruminantium]|uniref:Uncharacterized protein n=1 Tax=Selenomonas ruminantium TaxID=971 RepID=A0A1I0W6E8_SELRU|nr:hypothetical protein [Selenomonas ruminantium]SFA84325.1 hypothetical protein SAMN05216587_102233 [Selenomonas ruminantium]